MKRQVTGGLAVHSTVSLLIKVWSQLQQPSRLNGGHISHVLGGLDNFIVDNPETRRNHEPLLLLL